MCNRDTTRSRQLLGLALVLLATATATACRRPGPVSEAPMSEAPPTPPPTFVEEEPEPAETELPLGEVETLTLALGEGLELELQAQPLEAGRGWGFELELHFRNHNAGGTFDLGAPPTVSFMISVTKPDGSGFGSGGGCTYVGGSHTRTTPLAPSEEYRERLTWERGIAAGEVLEVGVNLCFVELPDGRWLGGEIAEFELELGPDGSPSRFGLVAVPVPEPR
jgi:hypothetical protein